MRAKSSFRSAFIFSTFLGVVCAYVVLIFAVCINENNNEMPTLAGDQSNNGSNKTGVKDSDKKSEYKENKSEKISENIDAGKSVLLSDRAWLFVYYTSKGHDGLFYAWSSDGLLWQQIRDGKPFLRPEVGGEVKERLMRAPSICRGMDGTYHMVWTAGWESKSIGYASSKDMINWSKQRLLPVMEHEKGTRNTWDPELFYDDNGKRFYIIWASTVAGSFKETEGTGEGNFNHRLYYTTTVDFAEFTQTKLYWNPEHNVIDPLLIEDKSGDVSERYLLFYKDETFKPNPKKNLLLATGASPTGPFNIRKVVSHTDWVQGPSVLRIGGDWYLYYDCYAKRHFGAVKSNDLNNWTNITEKLCFPTKARQGTIIEIDKETLKKLRELK